MKFLSYFVGILWVLMITSSGGVAAPAAGGGEPVSDQELQSRLNSADVVVVGRVTDVHPLAKAAKAAAHPRITEHDPNWQEAVIKVQSTIKGAAAKQVVVRFHGLPPKSPIPDVAYFGQPTFKVGQEQTFLLKSDQVTGAAKAMVAGAQVTAYTALNAGDVLSTADAARVRSLLKK